jgi:uncharacterized protein (TIGR03663 family)
LTIKIKNRIKITTPSLKIRWTVFAVLALLALAVRLPQLGERPMHTDESINAYITGELLAGENFHYDPQDRHGPALFALAEPVAKFCGAKNFPELTETQLRLSTVLTGTATVLLFGAGVEIFGFIPCLIAALLFAFAPLPVYYSRYFIHETLFVAATFGLILSGCRALKNKSLLSAALAGFCAALMLACKETAPLHYFALMLAGFACWIFRPRKKMAADFPPPKIILTAFAVFLFIAILLFTWFGQSWSGLADLFRAIPNFAARAGGQGHEKPFWYYAKLLCGGWSGAIILALGVFGIFCAFTAWWGERPREPDFSSSKNGSRGRSPHRVFVAIYALAIFAIYSAIPYKTPWLALNFWLPLTILAGIAVEWLWLASPKISARAVVLIFIAAIGFLILYDTNGRVFKNPADEKNPYAYAHTSEDLLRLPVRLEELARQNKISNPRIAVVAADAWPLPWYLRKFSTVGFWQPGQETGAADFFITTTEVSGNLAERLKNFRPEFFGVRPEVLLILWTPSPETKHE